jgi:class 3 adenylate cyclase
LSASFRLVMSRGLRLAGLGVLVGRELTPAVLRVDLRGFAALSRFARQHLEHVGVVQFP